MATGKGKKSSRRPERRDPGRRRGRPDGGTTAEEHEGGGGPGARLDYWDGVRGGDQGKRKRTRLLRASRLGKRAQKERIDALREESAPQRPDQPGPAGAVNWTPLGPSVVGFGQASGDPAVSGRVTALAVGPGGTRVYLGAANGGVWVTEDGGNTWEPLDDYFTAASVPANLQADSLAIGALAVLFGATRADDVVYAGTGESNQSLDSYSGVGIRRFGPPPGGGAPTWTLEATNLAGTWVSRLVIDPDSPDVVYASTGAGFYRRPAAGFATWNQLSPAPAPANAQATDLAVASTGADLRYYVGYLGGQVYEYNPATNTFTALTGVTAGAFDWVCVAAARVPAAAASQRVVYALAQSGALFRLAPGAGTAFTAVSGVPPVTNGQGWYDLAVAIEPGSADTVWLVGDWVLTGGQYNLSLWRGVVGTVGAPNFGFTNAGNPGADSTYRGLGVHADGHAVAFPSDGSATPLWIGCDGGAFRSTTGAAGTFQPRNTGLAITELTFMAQWPTTDAACFAGCQDNGTVRMRGEPSWFESPRGDGGGITIDPNNPYRVMRQYVRAGFYQGATFFSGLSTAADGGQSAGSWSALTFPPAGGAGASAAQRTAVNTENSRTAFYGPLASVYAGDLAQSLAAFGTNRVWLSTDWGATWNTLPTNSNPYGGGGTNLTQDVLDDPNPTVANNAGGYRPNSLQALTFAGPRLLYVATGAGVWRFDRTGTSTWTRTALPTTGLPAGRRITDIEVADATTGAIYVTLAGIAATHVYFFAGGTATSWTNCALTAGGANLDSPCHAVVIDPANTNILYVACDVGVFRGQKTGPSTWMWTPFSQGLPQAAVVDLAIHERTRLLRAATHGRGLWEIELDAATLAQPELYMRVNTADTGRLKDSGHRYSWVEGHPDPSRQGFNVYHWMSPDIKIRRPSLSGLPPIGSPPTFYDFAYNVGDYVDTGNTETIDAGVNRAFVQVHNRSLTPVDGSDVRVLLLLTDATTGLPNLPGSYAANIVGGVDPSTWVPGSGWFVGDSASPFRSPPGKVDARASGIVDFNIDVASLGLPATSDHVCAAAFVTTISAADRIAATESTLDVLTMQDRHAVHRNLHVVAAGAKPAPAGGAGAAAAQSFVFRVHNPLRKMATFELELRAAGEPLDLSIAVSRPGHGRSRGVDVIETSLERVPLERLERATRKHWKVWRDALTHLLARHRDRLEKREALPSQVERWRMQRLAELSSLDLRALHVTGGKSQGRFALRMPAGAAMTFVAAWTPPPTALPGWQTRLDVIQRAGKRIVGGNTYLLRVVEREG